MSRITRTSKGSQGGVVFEPSPFAKVPLELKVEIFKFVVLSSEEGRSHGAKTLCLVDKHWNNIANATSDLWTKVTLTYPFLTNKLSAVQKWLEASAQKAIDIEIDFCDPAWDIRGWDDLHPLAVPGRLRTMITVLRGSEHRWRSLSILSDSWRPVCEFVGAWAISSLPLLESICIERCDVALAADFIRIAPWEILEPPVMFGSQGSLLPRLREASLIGIPVDQTSATTSLRNLRKLELKNDSHYFGPGLKHLASFLAASPGLEVLDVIGYGPVLPPTQTEIPLVHLPALKHLALGWTVVDFACTFFEILQIPETLETLVLSDTETGFGSHKSWASGLFTYHDNSSGILETLTKLGSEASRGKDRSGPWVSMRGLKSVSVSWVDSDPCDFSAFMKGAPMIEEVRLTDVSLGVLEGIAEALVEPEHFQSLKKIYIRWIWNGGYESEEAGLVTGRFREIMGERCEVVVKEFRREDRGLVPVELEVLFNEENVERWP